MFNLWPHTAMDLTIQIMSFAEASGISGSEASLKVARPPQLQENKPRPKPKATPLTPSQPLSSEKGLVPQSHAAVPAVPAIVGGVA